MDIHQHVPTLRGASQEFSPTDNGALAFPLHLLLGASAPPDQNDMAAARPLSDALEDVAAAGVDLDAEIRVRDLVRMFLDESRFRRMARTGIPGKGKKKQGRRGTLEYWHRRAGKARLQPDTLGRAQALLGSRARDIAALMDIIDLYDVASKEIEGCNLDVSLIERAAEISLGLPAAEVPAGRLVEQAKRLFQYGKKQAAYEWHAQLVDAAPNHPELRNNLGFILIFRGDVARARRELERATDLGHGGGVHWTNRGVTSALLGNEVAEEELRRAVEESRGVVAAEIVLLLNERGADTLSSRLVLTAGTMKAIALCNLGYVLHQKHGDGARLAFEEAVGQEKKLSFALRAAGWYFHVGDFRKQAMTYFRRAREREPRHPMNDWESELLPPYYFFVGGPNDPCCCGSGEKFKRCCERQIA